MLRYILSLEQGLGQKEKEFSFSWQEAAIKLIQLYCHLLLFPLKVVWAKQNSCIQGVSISQKQSIIRLTHSKN